MSSSNSRGKRILQLVIGNQSTDNPTLPAPNLMQDDETDVEKNDDGDYSPASDEDRTYVVPKKKIRRDRSLSSSSSSSSSSASSSSSSNSSSSSSSRSSSTSSSTSSACSEAEEQINDPTDLATDVDSNHNVPTFDVQNPCYNELQIQQAINSIIEASDTWVDNEGEKPVHDLPADDEHPNQIGSPVACVAENIEERLSFNTIVADDTLNLPADGEHPISSPVACPAENTEERLSTSIIVPDETLNLPADGVDPNQFVGSLVACPADNIDGSLRISAVVSDETLNLPADGECPNQIVSPLVVCPADRPTVSTKKKIRKPLAAYIAKKLRDSGNSYVSTSKTKKIIPQKSLKGPCGSGCRLKCSQVVPEAVRIELFKAYWDMASLVIQREFIARHIEEIIPRYQYKRIDSTRKPKHAFYFKVSDNKVKVCKMFFKNTLSITDRCIRTVIKKLNPKTGVIEGEKRGKHKKQKKVETRLVDGVEKHINTIPRVESHYLRQHTTREYIYGGKTLTDLYSDYAADCREQGLPYVKIHTYRKIFNHNFNISFFIPKKDQCEQCTVYNLAEEPRKQILKENYDLHQAEKLQSRLEKDSDKSLVSDSYIVACYDLQAVMPIPKGEVSTFYYKSKINCLNFTISELKTDITESYFWDESQGNRGANEIGTCVLKYLQKKSSLATEDLDITFYSDNCCGQQKNQFIIGMYIYAVTYLKIKSITHKFLIRGHTQNEGDAVHSLIEKQVKRNLKSGPIYVPSQYISAIRGAKKNGLPFSVNEMSFDQFLDIKQLPIPKLNRDINGKLVKLGDIKVIKVVKNDQNDVNLFYKVSYFDDFKQLGNARKANTRRTQPQELKPLYEQKLVISERKRNDIQSLLDAGLIPRYYFPYFESILN